MDKIDKFFSDKRIIFIYVLVIIVLVSGITYALGNSGIALNIATATIGIDESKYGSTSFDSSNITLTPILDSEVETRLDNVIKIDFIVGGSSSNTANNIIYDIALVDLKIDCSLLNNFKWKLVKDGTTLYTNNFTFDTITNERLVLTDIQLDLPNYSSTGSGYHSYSFYIWLSDSCQNESIANCTASMDQSNLMGKRFSGKIEIELYTGSKKSAVRVPNDNRGSCIVNYVPDVPATTYVINKYNDGSNITTVNIAGDSSKPEVHLNATQGIMLDNNGEYRYYGANPNNYVTFNGETWRIIGAFNNIDDGTSKKETRLKIIRNESIGNYSYDTSSPSVNEGRGLNDWSKADLNTELNSLYYNSTSGNCYDGEEHLSSYCDFTSIGLKSDAKDMIDNAIYYLGGSSSESGLYASDYYTFERGTTVYDCSFNDGACPRATTWTGKVGLMYPSDYVYATDLSVCTKDGYNYDADTNCKNNDWLFNSSLQWTIAPYSSVADVVFYIYSTGFVDYHNDASRAHGVRPVIYLKSNVAIGSGEGTIDKPYQLKLT